MNRSLNNMIRSRVLLKWNCDDYFENYYYYENYYYENYIYDEMNVNVDLFEYVQYIPNDSAETALTSLI